MADKKPLGKLGKLSNLLNESAGREGVPLQLPVEKVKPDPENIRNLGSDQDKQQRQEFIEKELGPEIKERGVKQPISVRRDPSDPEGYIINAGEGRYLATVWAGLPTIPAWIDEDFTDFDNAKENTKRLGLSGRQLARFIKKKEAEGLNKKQIAEKLGISPSLVNQLANLLKLPACMEALYDQGLLNDLTTIAELMTVYKTFPNEVESWLAEQEGEILRRHVKQLRAELEEPKRAPEEPYKATEDRGTPGSGVSDPNRESGDGGGTSGSNDDSVAGGSGGESGTDGSGGVDDGNDAGQAQDGSSAKGNSKTPPDPDKIKRAIVQVKHDGRPARIILDKRPPAHGWAWLKYDDDGEEFEADLASVQLAALVEG